MSATIPNYLPKVDVSFNSDQKTSNRLTKYEAIRICEEKYADEFKRKKWITVAIAVGGLAMLIIPVVAVALMAISATTFNIGLLVAIPAVLVLSSLIVKKVEEKTHYWSGKLAENLIQIKEVKDLKKAKKVQEKAAAEKSPQDVQNT